MKKVSSFLLAGILVFCLVLAGCGSKPASTDGGNTADQPSDKTYELTFAYFGPEMIPPGHWSEEAAKRVEEKTNGRVKIKTYYAESLLKYGDTITGTASGVADIAFIDSGNLAGQFDLNAIFTRFMPQAPPQDVSTKVFRELINTTPELNAELEEKNLRWLSIVATPGEHLHTVKKQVRVPADVKGLKVAVVGETARWLETMGASPIGLAAGDFYMSLERGLVDGQWAFWPVLAGFKLTEVTNNHTVFGEYGANLSFTGYLINNNTWKSLPQDIQQILVEAYDWAGDNIMVANQEEVNIAIEAAKSKGSTFIELTPDELKQWEATMGPANQAWIDATEAKGKPAKQVFDKLFNLIEKYSS